MKSILVAWLAPSLKHAGGDWHYRRIRPLCRGLHLLRYADIQRRRTGTTEQSSGTVSAGYRIGISQQTACIGR